MMLTEAQKSAEKNYKAKLQVFCKNVNKLAGRKPRREKRINKMQTLADCRKHKAVRRITKAAGLRLPYEVELKDGYVFDFFRFYTTVERCGDIDEVIALLSRVIKTEEANKWQ